MHSITLEPLRRQDLSVFTSSSAHMSSRKRSASSISSLDATYRLSDDKGENKSSTSSGKASYPHGNGCGSDGSSSAHKRRQRDENDDPHTYLHIDDLVERMVDIRKSQDKAQVQELCSKMLGIIQDMKCDDVGLVTP